MSKRDYYDILGVSKDASESEIKKAYRKVAREYHPDSFSGASKEEQAEAEQKFKEANDAYQVLSDSGKKAQYDQYGHSAFEQGRGGSGFGGFGGSGGFDDLGDIFSSFFGGGGGFGGQRRPQPGNDLRYNVEITLEEAAKGVEKTIKYKRRAKCKTCDGSGAEPNSEMKTCTTCGGQGRIKQIQRTVLGNFENVVECSECHGTGKIPTKKCSTCHGSGITNESVEKKVNIPAGIDSGQRLKLSGMGEASHEGGPNGDLYIFITVKEHQIFERIDYDIICDVPISFKIAALGGEIKVPTLEGEIKIAIPEGTQTGKIFKLKEKGIPIPRTGRIGSQLVKVVVETPVSLNQKQKDILADFDDSLKEKNYKLKNNFFKKLKNMFK